METREYAELMPHMHIIGHLLRNLRRNPFDKGHYGAFWMPYRAPGDDVRDEMRSHDLQVRGLVGPLLRVVS